MTRTGLLRVGRAGWVWLALVVLSAAAGQQGPGRIAVVGAFPTSYAGTLARYGLPRETLFESQVANPAVLAKYDLVIVAGLPTSVAAAAPALRKVLEQGGAVLLDYSSPPLDLPVLFGQPAPAAKTTDRRAAARQRLGVTRISRSPLRFTNAGNPLQGEFAAGTTFPATRLAFVPVLPEGSPSTVLAEYAATTEVLPGELAKHLRDSKGKDTGPAAPAIVETRVGAGRLLLCGVGLGLGASVMGLDYDALVLALVRRLTNGRAVPQLTPEGPKLGRKESPRSLGLATDGPDTTTAAPAAPAAPRPAPPALPAGYTALADDVDDEFDVTGTLAGGGEILVNVTGPQTFQRIWLAPGVVKVAQVTKGKSRLLVSHATTAPSGAPFRVKKRTERLTVWCGGTAVTAELPGAEGHAGWHGGLEHVAYQGYETPAFSDDFMRTDADHTPWTTAGGTWRTTPVENPELGANPFSYKAEASPAAMALTGYDWWDEYRFGAAVRPGPTLGWCGLGVYAQNPRSMVQFRARLRKGQPVADGWQLVRLVDGQEQVLASAPGGFQAEQWYRVQVKVEGPWIGVFVDGAKVLVAQDATFPGGQIALLATQGTARFDDVLVESCRAGTDRGQRLEGRVPVYAGLIDVDSWAGPATPWLADSQTPGLFWRANSFFGDLGYRFDVGQLPAGGRALLLADGDGTSPQSGWAVAATRQGDQLAVELRHDGQPVANGTVAVPEQVSLVLRKSQGRVLGLINDDVVVRGAAAGPGGGRLAFQATGFRPKVSQLAVWSTNLRDYTFDQAPIDWWVGSGQWDVTNRWSCTPDWSWFGGYSDGVAAIWYKRELTGDLVVDYYVGPKMLEINGQKSERMGDFNVTFCGDGQTVDSGYSFVVGGKGGAEIRRAGVAVKTDPSFRLFSRGHNRWANVRAEKHGPQITLAVDGQPVLTWTDPAPLAGGYVSLWTKANGIMLPRITLSYEKLGETLLSLR